MEKKKEHIVLQIMNIIKLQRKNATILIRELHWNEQLLAEQKREETVGQESEKEENAEIGRAHV